MTIEHLAVVPGRLYVFSELPDQPITPGIPVNHRLWLGSTVAPYADEGSGATLEVAAGPSTRVRLHRTDLADV
jgi:hypothetical protein